MRKKHNQTQDKILILFVMAHAGFFRNFEQTIAELLALGFHVHVHFSKEHETIKLDDYDLLKSPIINSLTVSLSNTDIASNVHRSVRKARIIRDIIHYSRPQLRDASDLQARFARLQKKDALTTESRSSLQRIFNKAPERLKSSIEWVLNKYESIKSPHSESVDIIKKIKPDYLIVTPLVNFASREIDFVKAAGAKKIPTLLATASWDNLTNKGRLMVQPDHVAVWNLEMQQEAIDLHHVPKEKIWITGAPVFDTWFNRKVSRNREEFCKLLGFNPTRPIIVYVCSSLSITGKKENGIVKAWRKAISVCGNRLLTKANFLIRPHPMGLREWWDISSTDNSHIGEFRGAKVWPLNLKHPTTEEGRADFFDTLYHADVIVGLNTSTMIEAAILSKPVLTFLDHSAQDSQTGNLHFKYLEKSKFIRVANNLNEHIDHIIETLTNKNDVQACKDFITQFIRPYGKTVSASSKLVDFICDNIEQKKNIKLRVNPPMQVNTKEKIQTDGDYFIETVNQSQIRSLQLNQIFPGIEKQSLEIGAIDPDTAHANHVDMLYVCAVARHIRAREIFEFGTYLGRTTYHLALSQDAKNVYTLDLNPLENHSDKKLGRAVKSVHQLGLQGCFFRNHSGECVVHQLHGDSRTFDYTPYLNLMDFIFIDGGHSYELIQNDTLQAFKMLKPGGVIIWHDFAAKSRDVVTFAKEFTSSRPLFWVRQTSLLIYVDGINPMTHEAPVLPYARSVLKPEI